jgi:hypothetical protein
MGKTSLRETLASSITGPSNLDIDLDEHLDCSIQVNYAASPAGDLELQASSDGTTFNSITESVQTTDAGGGSHMWNVSGMQFRYLRVVIPTDLEVNEVLFEGTTLEVS